MIITKQRIAKEDFNWWDGLAATLTRIDSTGGVATVNKFGDYIDILHVYGGSSGRTLATIRSAAQQIGSRNVVFVLAHGTWTIDANYTLPGNIHLRIPSQTFLSIDSGKTLTVNGYIHSDTGEFETGSGTLTYGAAYGSVTFTNIAAMKALKAPFNGAIAHTRGYYTAGDGGHGDYYFVKGSSATANNFTIFADDGGTGRWFLRKSGEVLNVKQAGAKGDGTTDDSAAIQAAIDYFAVSDPRASGQGGILFMPHGIYKITTKITVKAGIHVFGDNFGTLIRTYYVGYSIQLGHSTANENNYNAGLSGLEIELMVNGAHGPLLLNPINCFCRDVRVQNSSGGTLNYGFVIDGGLSGHFNLLENCYALHCAYGYINTVSSGASYPTDSYYINCSAYGDDIAGSKGFYFDMNYGLDSKIFGGNVEHYATGIELVSTQGLGVYGLRFEANTLDVKLGTFATENSFIGCSNLNTKTHSTQNGYSKNTFFANSGSAAGNSIERETTFLSPAADKTPVTLQAYAAQSADMMKVLNSTGTLKFGLDGDGYVVLGAARLRFVYGSGSPNGAVTAPVGSVYFRDDGGASTTFYVKESGTGNTGWVAK